MIPVQNDSLNLTQLTKTVRYVFKDDVWSDSSSVVYLLYFKALFYTELDFVFMCSFCQDNKAYFVKMVKEEIMSY